MKKFLPFYLSIFLLTACTSAIDEQGYTNDPWEPLNRKVFVFNDALDTMLLKPIASGYHFVMPQFGENRVNAFFGNLDDINVLANSLMQFKFKQSLAVFTRLLNNTFFGLGGLFDVATPMGNHKIHNDFGATLSHYGIESGPYIVIPFLGPSTIRDGVGRSVDNTLFRPTSPLGYLEPESHRWTLTGMGLLQKRTNLLATEQVLDGNIGDKYLLMRDAWLQHRWHQLYGAGAISGQQDAIDAIFADEQSSIDE